MRGARIYLPRQTVFLCLVDEMPWLLAAPYQGHQLVFDVTHTARTRKLDNECAFD